MPGRRKHRLERGSFMRKIILVVMVVLTCFLVNGCSSNDSKAKETIKPVIQQEIFVGKWNGAYPNIEKGIMYVEIKKEEGTENGYSLELKLLDGERVINHEPAKKMFLDKNVLKSPIGEEASVSNNILRLSWQPQVILKKSN